VNQDMEMFRQLGLNPQKPFVKAPQPETIEALDSKVARCCCQYHWSENEACCQMIDFFLLIKIHIRSRCVSGKYKSIRQKAFNAAQGFVASIGVVQLAFLAF
ncbi:MAG: hypothetical protein AAF206_26860, partial [Bacteroidota bacterium]